MRSPCFRILPCCVAVALAWSSPARADSDVTTNPSGVSVHGPSGGLVIPGGALLDDGVASFSYNNYVDPRFAAASRGQSYLFGLGLLPYVEISGRLVNYPTGVADDFLLRDLSGNLKLGLPRLFAAQPDLAIGINDLGGGAKNFRSKYAVASQSFGPLRATLGYGRGEAYLNGPFGGLEYAFGDTGFSALLERANQAGQVGVRYFTKPIASLGDARVGATLQRSVNAHAPDGSRFDRTSFALQLVIPFGDAPKTPSRAQAALQDQQAFVSAPAPAPILQNTATDAPRAETTTDRAPLASRDTVSAPPGSASPVQSAANPANTPFAPVTATSAYADLRTASQAIRSALEKAGLERVRVGRESDRLVIEYENHRYNQNEVDALGIVLAIGAKNAPEDIHRISAVTKRANLRLYETTVGRNGFLRFLSNGDAGAAQDGFSVTLHPDVENVQWSGADESAHGYSRVVLEPVLHQFVGTEYGLYDYSVGASAKAIVPLWKGAEASTHVISHLADSKNVSNGIFNYGQLRSGLNSAILSQSFWVGDHILNVASVGKFAYDFTGVQNQTVFFVPGRDDQVRLQYTRLHYSDRFNDIVQVDAGAFYRWTYQPLNLWVEAGYSQYVANDRGPSLRVSRWFGDVQAQAFVRKSEQATFAGFQLVFPLTPRRGMRSGWTSLEGPTGYAYGLETRLVSQGGANSINRGVAVETSPEYSVRDMLFNRGRVGKDYFASQLPRMREAALLYAVN